MIKKIAHVTDVHLEEQFPIEQGVETKKNWRRVLKDIASRNINEMIFGGDIGEKSSHLYFFESLENFELSFVLGNHDEFSEVKKYYRNKVVENKDELFYSLEDAYYRYIYLDSSAGSISQKQLDWLIKELKTDSQVVIFIHHPILAIDVEIDKKFPLEGREEIKLILQKAKKAITVFCGHYHINDESLFDNIKQYVTPAVSFQVEKDPNEIKIDSKTFGYRIIEFTEQQLNTEVIMF